MTTQKQTPVSSGELKIFEVFPMYMDHIPTELEPEGLYISKRFSVAIHLCACGCGVQTVTPLKDNGWTLTENDGKITLRPSIGNFKGENPYHAHYYITGNKVEWL